MKFAFRTTFPVAPNRRPLLEGASLIAIAMVALAPGASAQSLNISGAQNVGRNGDVSAPGNINVLSTGLLNFIGPGGTATLASGTGNIFNNGRIRLFSGNVAVTGDLTNQGSGRLVVTGGDMTGVGTLTNRGNGLVTVGAGHKFVATTAIDNRSAATINSLGVIQAPTITNAGTMNVEGKAWGDITNKGAGALTVTGPLTGNGAIVNQDKAVFHVAGGPATGFTTLDNSSKAPEGVKIDALLDLRGVATNRTGGTIRVGANGELNATAGVVNEQNATINVDAGGKVVDKLTNAGTVNNTGNYVGDVDNAGTGRVNNKSPLATWNGNVLNNAGRIVNEAGATWTGNVFNGANKPGGVIRNEGTWNGIGNNSGGKIINVDEWNGRLVNQGPGGLINNTGTVSGGLSNKDGNSINSGTINNGAVVTGGKLRNEATGDINGGLTQTGGATRNEGTIAGGAKISGGAFNNAGGTVSGGLANRNNATSFNSGVINGGATVSGGQLRNDAGGQINGGLIQDGGKTRNDGVISGDTNIRGGTLNTTGTINGDLRNSATVFAEGAVSGAIRNFGDFNVTNSLTSGSVVNGTAGELRVKNGTLSTNTVSNQGKVIVRDGATLDANGVVNKSTGEIRVDQGGTVNDHLDNAGVVNNAGAYNADLVNTGGAAVVTNKSTGVWTGRVLSNSGGARIVNQGQWTGRASNNLGGTIDNQNLWTGAITNDLGATYNNSLGSSVLNGSLTNNGTVNARGAINGKIVNSGQFNVIGALVSNNTDTVINGGPGTLDVGAFSFTNIKNFVNAGTTTIGAGGKLAAENIQTSGTIVNDGKLIGATKIAINGGTVTNNRLTASNAIVVNAGTLTNSATGAVVAGALSTGVNGAVNNAGIVSSAAEIQNKGTYNNNTGGKTKADLNNKGTFVNAPDATLTGGLKNSGTATNGGTIRGDVQNQAGLYNQSATGVVGGGLRNAAGATARAAGRIKGDVANAGSFVVTGGDLVTGSNIGSKFENNGQGTLAVTGGDLTIKGTLTNNSSAAPGVTVDNNTLKANFIVNRANATMLNNGVIASTTSALVNSGLFIQNAGKSLSGGFDNRVTGTANVAGAINGRIDNRGAFTVTGPLNGNGNFHNFGSGVLSVGVNSFTGVGGFDNEGRATIDAGGLLGAVKVFNSGAMTNSGGLTTTAGLFNRSTFTNNTTGTITGNVKNSAGAAFTSTGVILGDVLNNGVFNAQNKITGAVINNNEFNLTGNLDPTSFVNNSVLNLGSNALVMTPAAVGVVTNNGTIRAVNAVIDGALTNRGTIDLTRDRSGLSGTVASLGNTLRVTGPYDGGGSLNITASLNNDGGQRAGELLVDGAGSGTTAVNVTSVGPTAFFATPVLVARTGGGGTFRLNNAGALGGGVVSVSLQQLSVGQWFLVPRLDTGALSSIGGSVASAISSAVTGFFQGATAFISSPPDAKPNQFSQGLWVRTAVGRNDLSNSSSSTTALGPTATYEKTRTLFSGYQVGYDLGLANIENTQINAHLGITAGQYFADAFEMLGTGTASRFNIPFVGIYGAATGHGFFADFMFRHDFWNTNITNGTAGLRDRPVNGHGWAGSVSAGYHYDVIENWFVEPSAAIHLTSVDIPEISIQAGTVPALLKLSTVRSALGRLGVRVGTSMVLDQIALQPYGSMSVWRELEGQITETFSQGTSNVPILVSRAGTFGQFGLGLSAQVIDTGLVGFVRGDYRTGDKLSGATFNGGLRYSF